MVFTASGSFDYSISVPKSTQDLVIDSSGKIYLSDNGNNTVNVYASGSFSYSIGSGIAGNEPGDLNRPNDVAVDSSGNVYVSVSGGLDRIHVFKASGEYDYSITSLDYSRGVCMDTSGKIYVASNSEDLIKVYSLPSETTHTVESGNVSIGTTSPTEQLEVDGNVKLTNGLILTTGSSSVSQTTLKAMTQSEARTITLPDASGVIIVTDDGTITAPDGSITASKLANNPGNGPSGQTLISNGDGSFDWGGFVTTQESVSASFDYSFGNGQGSEIGQFNSIRDIAFDSNDNIFVADYNNHRIQVFTSSGEYSYSLGTGNSGFGQNDINAPMSIEIDSNDNIYVLEVHRIHIFTAEGDNSYSFGGIGFGEGEFGQVSGIAMDNDGNIYVADTGMAKNCIHIFSNQGNFNYSYSSKIDHGGNTYDVAIDNSGNIYVSDDLNCNIKIYDDQKNLIDAIDNGFGTEPGQLNLPRGIDVDSDGLIYVAELINHRIQVFTATGDYSYSISDGLSFPSCVTVHKNKIYIGDGSNCIMIFDKPGKPATHIVETGNVGIGTTAPSDTLDVSGTFKITEELKLQPRDTPPDAASEGMVYFDSGDNKLKVYNGTEWKVCF
jgi:sugar lactone lactonase YvrE